MTLLLAAALIAQSPDQFAAQVREGRADWQALAKKFGTRYPGQVAPCSDRAQPCHIERLDLDAPVPQAVLVIYDGKSRQAYIAFRQEQPSGVFFAEARTPRPTYRIDDGYLRVPVLGVHGSDWYSEPEAWLDLASTPFRSVLRTDRYARENAFGFGITTYLLGHTEVVSTTYSHQRIQMEMSLLGHPLGTRTYWVVFQRTDTARAFRLHTVHLDQQRQIPASLEEFLLATDIAVDGVPGRQAMLRKLTADALRTLARQDPELRRTIEALQ